MTDLPGTLEDWLARCEQLHPLGIDMGLARVGEVWKRLNVQFSGRVVTVAGTNGKGSSCAMLESIGLQAGYRVGLYIKPHLVDFEERCRVMGKPVAAETLLEHFEAVEQARGAITLTYFEFTTLVILRALAAARLDLVILEVGLGGRLDAVNVVDADCVILTSIDLDHVEYLGNNRDAIGLEKAHVMRAGRPAIVSDPVPPQSVIDHAQAVGADLWLVGRDFNHSGDRQQWAWAGRGKRYAGLAYPALRGANQLINAAGVLAAVEALRLQLPMPAQAIRNGLALVELPGRFQIVPGQPNLVLDVAHNPQSVATLALNLDQMGFFPRTHAVLGAMADKALPEMFRRMAPLVDSWHLCALPTPRAAQPQQLKETLEQVRSEGGTGWPQATIQLHPDPAAALAAALAGADPADRIVVFGSFYTVGGVLREGLPRLGALHGS